MRTDAISAQGVSDESRRWGCYCGEVRYEAEGDPVMKAQCFCRECQYITGGDSLLVMGVPEAGFKVTKGSLKGFQRKDIENAVTREFCPNCGTHMTTRGMPGVVMIKVGTLDDPAGFRGAADGDLHL